MKNSLILIFLFINIVLSAQRFSGGFLGGLNASQVDGDFLSGYNKFGVAFGAFTYTALSETFDIQLELKYMGKGARSKTTPVGVEYTNQLNYIDIPIVFRMDVNSKIDIEFGTGVGYLFSKISKDIYGNSASDDSFTSIDWHGIFGLHYPITEQLFVNLRFSYSLLNIRKNLDPKIYPGKGVRNNVLSICLYYDLSRLQ